MRRRSLLGPLTATVALLTVVACGAPAPEAGGGGGDAPDTTTSGDGAFPVTVATAFGDVTVPEAPERVVALGWGDAETAVALGVEPVGASDWLAFGGDGLGPWMTAGYATPPEIVGTLEPDLEQIAALEPDLILDTRSSGDQERYDSLARLGVPVVGPPPDAAAYLTGWRDQLDLVGQVLGQSAEADALRTSTETALAEAAAENPTFAGRSVVFGSLTSVGYGAYVDGDTRVEFMRELGFVNSPAVQELASGNFFVEVSAERTDLLDADLTVMVPIGVPAANISDDPLFQTVPSVRDGRAVVLDDQAVSDALSAATAPGVAFAVESAVPLFAAALG